MLKVPEDIQRSKVSSTDREDMLNVEHTSDRISDTSTLQSQFTQHK